MLVTALFDLSQFEANAVRRNIDFYMDHCNYVLRQKSPLVIFTELALVDKITERRLQFLTPAEHTKYTTYVVKPMQELKYFDDGTLDTIRHNWSKHPYESSDPGKMTPAYVALMWNKFEFMRQAADMFPDQEVFGWIDMAIGRVCKDNPDVGAVVANSNPNTFSVTVLNPATLEEIQNMVWYYSCWKYHVAGNFWCIGRTLLPEFLTCISQYIAEALAAEVAGPDEEIMARFVVHRPENCSFFFGDYGYTISNRIHFRDDAHGTTLATTKAHERSLHHIAIAGYQTLMQAGIEDIFSLHITQVLSWTTNVYIHMYYVDREKAKEVAEFLKCMRDKHVYIMNDITSRQQHYQSLFDYVNVKLTDPNLETPETPWLQALRLWIENDCHKWMRVADVPKGTDWGQVLTDNFHHFVNLQHIVAKSGTGFTGSYLIRYELTYEPQYFLKQQGLFNLMLKSRANTILEIGVNAGHSLLIMLLAHRFSQSKETLKFVTFDLCEFKHTQPCVDYLNQHFGDCIELIPGASPGTVEQYFQEHPECHFDIYHVDGCHQWNVIWRELLLCGCQAKTNDYILLDDVNTIPRCFHPYWTPLRWQTHLDHPNSAYQVKQTFPATLRANPLPIQHIPYNMLYHSLFHEKRDQVKQAWFMNDTKNVVDVFRQYFPHAHIVNTGQDVTTPGSMLFDLISLDRANLSLQEQVHVLQKTFPRLQAKGVYVIHHVKTANVDWLKEAGIAPEYVDAMEEYHMDNTRLVLIWKGDTAYCAPIDVNQIYQMVKPYTALSLERIVNNIRCVQDVIRRNIPGDIIEIGVWRGGSVVSMIMTLQHHKVTRPVHLYDTFMGMTEPGQKDVDYQGQKAADIFEAVKCEASLADVQNTLSNLDYPSVKYHVGDIRADQDPVPENIAVLRLDVDWYDGTMAALNRFYDHVTPGGYVIIDDYGHWQGCKQAVDEFINTLPNRDELQLQKIDYTGMYWKKPM
jgi:O-methyltransferase